MAKGAYIGVDTALPIYGEGNVELNVTSDNISDVFDVLDGSTNYGFRGSGSVFTSNNKGMSSITATTTLTAKYDMTVSFTYSYSSEAGYDKFTLVFAGTTIENGVSGPTTVKQYSGSLTKGQTIVFTYEKDGSTNSNDDECTFSAMTVSYFGTTQIGTTVKSIARKIKKMYIGVDSLARKVKKAYIGVGGVARLFFSSGNPRKIGTATNLEYGTYSLAGASVGNYALFAGGYSNTAGDVINDVNAYSQDLVKSTPNGLSLSVDQLAGASTPSYAIFAGGSTSSLDSSWMGSIFDDNCVRVYYDKLLTKASKDLAGASVGNYALFAGGITESTTYLSNVDAIDDSLVTTVAPNMQHTGAYLSGANVGNYALFAGGCITKNYYTRDTVDAYSTELVHTNIANLSSSSCWGNAAASTGKYAVFAGGENSSGKNAYVDAYDSDLVKTTAPSLARGRGLLCGLGKDGYAFFAGGRTNVDQIGDVDVYDDSLVRTTMLNLNTSRQQLAGAIAGDYLLFAGGASSVGVYYSKDDVDVYTI